MPVEIREITIKTEIQTSNEASDSFSIEALKKMKLEILAECKRFLSENRRKRTLKR